MKHALRKKILEFQDEELQHCREGALSDLLKQKISSRIVFDLCIRLLLGVVFAVLHCFLYFPKNIEQQEEFIYLIIACQIFSFGLSLWFFREAYRSFKEYSKISTITILTMDISMSDMEYVKHSGRGVVFFLVAKNIRFGPVGHIFHDGNLSPMEQLFDESKMYRLYYVEQPLILLAVDELE